MGKPPVLETSSFPSHANVFSLPPTENRKLQPLLCSPEQFFTAAQQSEARWNGERRLLFAVLQDAIACWFRYRHARSEQGRQLFHEICDWFWEKDQQGLYAFESICIHLNLDPEYVRRGLFGWDSSYQEQPRYAYWTAHKRFPHKLLRRRS